MRYPSALQVRFAFTVNILKIGTPKIITAAVVKLRQFGFTVQKMRLKEATGIANSVDPDQTAPFRSSLIRVCIVCSDLLPKYFQFLRYANRQVWNFRSSLIRVCIVCSDLLPKYFQFLRYANRQVWNFRSSLIRVCIVCSDLLPKYLQFLRYANRQDWNFRSSLIRVCIVCTDLLSKYLQFLRYTNRQVWNLKIDNQNKHLTPSLVSLSKINTLQKS